MTTDALSLYWAPEVWRLIVPVLGLYISRVILGIQATLEPDRNAFKGIAAHKKTITAVHYISTNKTGQVRD